MKKQLVEQVARAWDKSNPKEQMGVRKFRLDLVPPAGLLYTAQAMEYGALLAPRADGKKGYGPFNWREAGQVRASVYLAAMQRHILACIDGEDVAMDSGCHHIAHVLANGAIYADAVEGGFLVDDRPPPGPAGKIMANYALRRGGK